MLTEAEAKEKWCQFSRVIPAIMANGAAIRMNEVPPHNRIQEPGATEATWHAAMNCIGSQCMGWRWRRRYADDEREDKITHATGYCGLAGKP